MLAYIEGKLVHRDPAYVVIDVGGLGYEVKISLQTYAALPEGERCCLHTYFSLRSDVNSSSSYVGHLFGFAELDEKSLFLDLTGVSGIGPNTALVMLSTLSAGEIRQAILSEDVRVIQGIKGIGAKTAQRVILELKDKIRKDAYAGNAPGTPNIPAFSNNTTRNEALSALITLGIPRAAAEKSVDAILKKEGSDLSVQQLIKLALR